jgi:hypothetical protein
MLVPAPAISSSNIAVTTPAALAAYNTFLLKSSFQYDA